MRSWPLLLVLAACPDPDDTGKVPGGSDLDEDTAGDSGTPCVMAATGVSPETGATGVYYRDPLQATFTDGAVDVASFTLVDAAGNAGTIEEITWSEGYVQATLSVVLEPSTTYTLTAAACETSVSTTFTTSDLGTALSLPASDLIGRTYMFRLSEDADITEPPFLEAVAGSYLSVPLLFGVTDANDSIIDLLGALGYHESTGEYVQVEGDTTWDFPAADFTEAPYFEAEAERIVITYQGVDIPIENFHLAGTFSADGTQIAEGTATGLGDSRYLGALMGRDDEPGAICEIAEAAGVYCTECSDGEPWCLYIVAENITADWEEGLTLVPYP